ncbi:hypothetical protein ACHAW6_009123 [Cyclotella cf. meneghiniana]
MYCGDETGAYIGDVGSHTSRFGYGGEDCPKVVLPSAVYRHYGGIVDHRDRDHVGSGKKRKSTKYSAPVSLLNVPPDDCFDENEVGFVPIYNSINSNSKSSANVDVDVEALAALWECSYRSLAVRDRKKHTVGPRHEQTDTNEGPIDHPLLASIDPHRGEKHHASILEMLFEALSAPAAYLAPSATLSAFSFGRPTALVVDVGHSSSRVTPVMDGYTLKFGSVRSQRGGEWLAHVQEKVLVCNDLWGEAPCAHGVLPRYMLRDKHDNLLKLKLLKESSFHYMSVHQVMYEMMTGSHVLPLEEDESSLSVPFFDDDKHADNAVDDEEMDEEVQVYVLPDGTRLDLGSTKTGRDLCRLPELFFSETLPTSLQTDSNNDSDNNITTQPLHQLVQHSLSQILDADIRKELISNIILTGSSSLFTGMDKRLSSELSLILPSMYKNKVICSKNSVENRYSAWIGGSILSSLGSFQQMWLSRREYDECGSLLGLQKFHS